MTERKPLGLYEGSPGQFRPGDFVPISAGGTGAGTPEDARHALSVKQLLTDNIDIAVIPSGNPEELELSPNTPIYTSIGQALDAYKNCDFNGYEIYIILANGTYDEPISLDGCINGKITLVGNYNQPELVVLNGSGNDGTVFADKDTTISIAFLTVESPYNNCLFATNGGSIICNKIFFGNCASSYILCTNKGTVRLNGDTKITSTIPEGEDKYESRSFVEVINGTVDINCFEIELINEPIFYNGFVNAQSHSTVTFNSNFTGSGVGERYRIGTYSVIDLNGNDDEEYFPLADAGINDGSGYYGKAIVNQGGAVKLTADLTINVSATGNDEDPVAAGSYKTIAAALKSILSINVNGYNVFVQLADGNYNENIYFDKLVNGNIHVLGNKDNFEAVVINTSGPQNNDGLGTIYVDKKSILYVQDLNIQTARLTESLVATNGGQLIAKNIFFSAGPTTKAAVRATKGGRVDLLGKINISMECSSFIETDGCVVEVNATVFETSSFSLNYLKGFINASNGARVKFVSVSKVGDARGFRFITTNNSIIEVPAGQTETYLPARLPGVDDGSGIFNNFIAKYKNKLTSDVTYNVNVANGSDSNPSANGSYKTIGAVINLLKTFDVNGFTVTIKLASGTYPEKILVDFPFNGKIDIIGSVNGIIDAMITGIVTGEKETAIITADKNVVIHISDLHIASFLDHSIIAKNGATVYAKNIFFGQATKTHLLSKDGGTIVLNGRIDTYNSTGSFAYLDSGYLYFSDFGLNAVPVNFNITDAAYTDSFIKATNTSKAELNVIFTITGIVVGSRYELNKNSIIKLPSAIVAETEDARTFLPGNVDGINDGTGIYIEPIKNVLPNNYRALLLNNTTFYVRSDGNDSNTGLTDNADAAFLTIQAAVDHICTLDLLDYQATIKIASGSYKQVTLKKTLGSKPVKIIGDIGSSTSVIFTGADTFSSQNYCIGGVDCGTWRIGGINFTPTNVNQIGVINDGVFSLGDSKIIVESECTFNTNFTGANQVHCSNGGKITIDAELRLLSGAHHFARVDGYGALLEYGDNGSTQIIENDLTYTRFMYVANRGLVTGPYLTYEVYATVTGFKYLLASGGIISVSDSGSWPGDKEGVIESSESYFGEPTPKRIVKFSINIYVSTTAGATQTGSYTEPFSTITSALTALKKIDTGGVYTANIKLFPGTHTVNSAIILPYVVGNSDVNISGLNSNTTTSIINFTGSMADGNAILQATGSNGKWTLRDLTLTSTGTGVITGIMARGGSEIIFRNINFGTGLSHHYHAVDGGVITVLDKYSISGGSGTHMSATKNGTIHLTNVVATIPSSVAITNFAVANTGGVITYDGGSFTGTVVGKKFLVESGGIITSSTGRADLLLPGSIAGTVSTLGICDNNFGAREKLSGSREYYVRIDGNDLNTGLVYSPTGAFKTIQKAIDVIANLDIDDHQVIINISHGTHEQFQLKKTTANRPVRLIGDGSNYEAVIITDSGSNPFNHCIYGNDCGTWIIGGMYLKGAPEGIIDNLIRVGGNSKIIIESPITFGRAKDSQIFISNGGEVVSQSIIVLSDSANHFVKVDGSNSVMLFDYTRITDLYIVNQPTYALSFASVTSGGKISAKAISFSGGVIGKKFVINGYSSIDFTANVTAWPGTTPGEIDSTSYFGAPKKYREKIDISRAYFVSFNGNDIDDGSQESPFKTIQKAIDTASNLDNNGNDVYIYLASGTWTETSTFKSIVGSGRIIILGVAQDMSSTIINTTNVPCFSCGTGFAGTYYLRCMKLQKTGPGATISGGGGGGTVLWGAIDFGPNLQDTQVQLGANQFMRAEEDYIISGSAYSHVGCYDAGHARVQGRTVQLVGNPAFNSFVTAARVGTVLMNGCTWVGTATGSRFSAHLNGVLYTGAGLNYLPGDLDGFIGTGGEYQ